MVSEVEMSQLLVLVGCVFWGGFFVCFSVAPVQLYLSDFRSVLRPILHFSYRVFCSFTTNTLILFASFYFIIAYLIDIFLAFRMCWLYARFVIPVSKSVDSVLYHFGM